MQSKSTLIREMELDSVQNTVYSSLLHTFSGIRNSRINCSHFPGEGGTTDYLDINGLP